MTNLPAGIGWTALLVARARANESRRPDPLFEDALAAAFVDAGGELLAAAENTPGAQEDVNRWREDYVALRTHFLDSVLTRACQSIGCAQVVLLAAGLDARAFRLEWPPATRLFELDMPDVFAFKDRVLREHNAAARCERIVVARDLHDDNWPSALRQAGFSSEEPTAWLVEGLLMYLTEDSRDRLLEQMTNLSPRNSHLGLDHRPGFFAPPTLPGAHGGHLPATHVEDPSLVEPGAWLARHGWHAEVHYATDLFHRHRRSLPPSLETDAPGARLSWLASAVKL